MVKKPPITQHEKGKRRLRWLAAAGLLGAGIALQRLRTKAARRIPPFSEEDYIGYEFRTNVNALRKKANALWPKLNLGKDSIVFRRGGSASASFEYRGSDPPRVELIFPVTMNSKGYMHIRPGPVAHEMGHAASFTKYPRFNNAKFWLGNKLKENERAINAGMISGSLGGAVATKDSNLSPRTKRILAGTLIAAPFLPYATVLGDEVFASIRAMRLLKKAGYSRKTRLREAGLLAKSAGAYALRPASFATMPAAVIASPSWIPSWAKNGKKRT